MHPSPASPPRRVLLIALQRLGDVLLTTPLMQSLRRAWPHAHIDVLVYQGTQGVLEGNPDLDGVFTTAQRASLRERLALLARLWRGYDLAITTQAGDTPHLLAWAAARQRVGLVASLGWESAWKRRSCARWVLLDDVHTHTVAQNLALAKAMGLDTSGASVVPPRANPAAGSAPLVHGAYAVLHPYPMYRYKRWPDAHWVALARALQQRGLQVVLSGGPDTEERAACARMAAACGDGCRDLSGRLGFGALAGLLRDARLYVGPDTVTTHLAAACGTPTVALFGPSNPVKWGPWPAAGAHPPSPYVLRGRSQRARSVILLQGPGDCVPCRLEGCERHRESPSRCLDELEVDAVLRAADRLLAESRCAS
ncbi:MAG: glycosyltransferase family 9 protein [Tibeticola sp.]